VISGSRTLVMIPTYNESDNVGVIVSGILSTGINADLLFVDDGSPDGTSVILDRLAGEHPQLKVLHRSAKLGVGSAHKAGIQWAYQHGYTQLVTMDSDLSHSPSDIPRLLAADGDADVVVGSRFVEADSLEGWIWYRKLMTHLGHLLTRLLLRMPHDCTNAFRFYRLDRIPSHIFEAVQSNGYSFFFESLHRLNVKGITISQIAIKLPARTYGHSKMRFKDVVRSVLLVLQLGWRSRPERASPLHAAQSAGPDGGKNARADFKSVPAP
jgi:dolichol-phosphate mannosyltransferase